MRTFRISLEDMNFFAYHGVFEIEKREGNDFVVNLHVDYQPVLEASEWTDSIYDTISYVALYDIVKEEMSESRDLMETVAQSIAERIKNEFAEVARIECRITKKRPPIPDFNGSASVCYILTND